MRRRPRTGHRLRIARDRPGKADSPMIRSGAPAAPGKQSLSSPAGIPWQPQFRARNAARAVTSSKLDRSGARSEQQASGPGPTADVARMPMRAGRATGRTRRTGRCRAPGRPRPPVVGYAEWRAGGGTQRGEAHPAPQQRPRALDRAASSSRSNKAAATRRGRKAGSAEDVAQRARSPPRASTRRCVSGVGVTNAYPASASAGRALPGSTARDASTPAAGVAAGDWRSSAGAEPPSAAAATDSGGGTLQAEAHQVHVACHRSRGMHRRRWPSPCRRARTEGHVSAQLGMIS